MSEQKKQGIFVIGAFDRLIESDKKNEDGTFNKRYHIGMVLRTAESTKVMKIGTKNPDKYRDMPRDTVLALEVDLSVFKGNLYYYEA